MRCSLLQLPPMSTLFETETMTYSVTLRTRLGRKLHVVVDAHDCYDAAVVASNQTGLRRVLSIKQMSINTHDS